MSDMDDQIKFRMLVISFAEDLSAEEIHKVAYTWLQHRGEVGTYSPHNPNRASGIELFSKLECLGVFSSRNVSGLADIAKTMNRPDLVGKVKEFSRKRRTATRSSRRKKSQENQELQNVLGTMVDQVTVLLQHINLLQKTMSTSESDIMDEGIEIIGGSSAIAKELAINLSQAHKKLKLRPRPISSESASSDDSTNAEISQTGRDSVEYAPGRQQEKQTKPTPKPRIGNVSPRPVQEVAEDPSKTTPSPHSCPKSKPPVTPRKSIIQPSIATPPAEVRQEENEGTGDSGLETGSGNPYYSTLLPFLRRQPEKKQNVYMSLWDETREEVLPYEQMSYDGQ